MGISKYILGKRGYYLKYCNINNIMSSVRTKSFNLSSHCHGKTKVRVLKVRRNANRDPSTNSVNTDDKYHDISEYTVESTLWSPIYSRVFTDDNNNDLVATDTQKNTVYVVAKRSQARSPEEFGIDLCKHFLNEYSILTSVEMKVDEIPWRRAIVQGVQHDHAFEHPGHETWHATVNATRDSNGNIIITNITSAINNMTVLKTTQSGFNSFMRDKYTMLPDCTERCLSTHIDCSWTYAVNNNNIVHHDTMNYNSIRNEARKSMCFAVFGPPQGGVYSESLQATIYDMGCVMLTNIPEIQKINISTPNVHYLPCVALNTLGRDKVGDDITSSSHHPPLLFEDDIFIPTSEPSGSIRCTVEREVSDA